MTGSRRLRENFLEISETDLEEANKDVLSPFEKPDVEGVARDWSMGFPSPTAASTPKKPSPGVKVQGPPLEALDTNQPPVSSPLPPAQGPAAEKEVEPKKVRRFDPRRASVAVTNYFNHYLDDDSLGGEDDLLAPMDGFSFSIAAHRSRAPPAPRRMPSALHAIREASVTAHMPAHQQDRDALPADVLGRALKAPLPPFDEPSDTSGEISGQLQSAEPPSALISTVNQPVIHSTEESSAHEQAAQELPRLTASTKSNLLGIVEESEAVSYMAVTESVVLLPAIDEGEVGTASSDSQNASSPDLTAITEEADNFDSAAPADSGVGILPVAINAETVLESDAEALHHITATLPDDSADTASAQEQVAAELISSPCVDRANFSAACTPAETEMQSAHTTAAMTTEETAEPANLPAVINNDVRASELAKASLPHSTDRDAAEATTVLHSPPAVSPSSHAACSEPQHAAAEEAAVLASTPTDVPVAAELHSHSPQHCTEHIAAVEQDLCNPVKLIIKPVDDPNESSITPEGIAGGIESARDHAAFNYALRPAQEAEGHSAVLTVEATVSAGELSCPAELTAAGSISAEQIDVKEQLRKEADGVQNSFPATASPPPAANILAAAEHPALVNTESAHGPAVDRSGGSDSPANLSPKLPEKPAEVAVDDTSAAAHVVASVIRYPTPAAESPAPAARLATSAAELPAWAAELAATAAESPAPATQLTGPDGQEVADHALLSVIRYPTPFVESPQPVRMAIRATPAPAKKQGRLVPVAAGVPIATPGSSAEGRWELWDEGSMTETGTPIPPKPPTALMASAATPAAAGKLQMNEQPYSTTPAGKPPGVRALASRFAREEQLAVAGQLGTAAQQVRPDSAGEGRWELWSEGDGFVGAEAQIDDSPVEEIAEDASEVQLPLPGELLRQVAIEAPSPSKVPVEGLSEVQPIHEADSPQEALSEIPSAAEEGSNMLSDMQLAQAADVSQEAPAEIPSAPEELCNVKPAPAAKLSVISVAEETIAPAKGPEELSKVQPAEAANIHTTAGEENYMAAEEEAEELSKVQPPQDADSFLGSSPAKQDATEDLITSAAQEDAVLELSPPKAMLKSPRLARAAETASILHNDTQEDALRRTGAVHQQAGMKAPLIRLAAAQEGAEQAEEAATHATDPVPGVRDSLALFMKLEEAVLGLKKPAPGVRGASGAATPGAVLGAAPATPGQGLASVAAEEEAQDDDEPIFAYISSTGIVTPAKAALTPATQPQGSARKSRFLPASVPRQPFRSQLSPSAEEEEDDVTAEVPSQLSPALEEEENELSTERNPQLSQATGSGDRVPAMIIPQAEEKELGDATQLESDLTQVAEALEGSVITTPLVASVEQGPAPGSECAAELPGEAEMNMLSQHAESSRTNEDRNSQAEGSDAAHAQGKNVKNTPAAEELREAAPVPGEDAALAAADVMEANSPMEAAEKLEEESQSTPLSPHIAQEMETPELAGGLGTSRKSAAELAVDSRESAAIKSAARGSPDIAASKQAAAMPSLQAAAGVGAVANESPSAMHASHSPPAAALAAATPTTNVRPVAKGKRSPSPGIALEKQSPLPAVMTRKHTPSPAAEGGKQSPSPVAVAGKQSPLPAAMTAKQSPSPTPMAGSRSSPSPAATDSKKTQGGSAKKSPSPAANDGATPLANRVALGLLPTPAQSPCTLPKTAGGVATAQQQIPKSKKASPVSAAMAMPKPKLRSPAAAPVAANQPKANVAMQKTREPVPISRLRKPAGSSNFFGEPKEAAKDAAPIRPAPAAKEAALASEPSHIPRPSAHARPPRASAVFGSTGVPRLAASTRDKPSNPSMTARPPVATFAPKGGRATPESGVTGATSGVGAQASSGAAGMSSGVPVSSLGSGNKAVASGPRPGTSSTGPTGRAQGTVGGGKGVPSSSSMSARTLSKPPAAKSAAPVGGTGGNSSDKPLSSFSARPFKLKPPTAATRKPAPISGHAGTKVRAPTTSPPVRPPAPRAACEVMQTPPPLLDRRTPEYERMLNQALADDEANAFKGRSAKVANSPVEGTQKPEQPTRLTAYDKHLREWEGEPLA